MTDTKSHLCHFQSYANRTCAYFINIKGAKKLCDHVYPVRWAADGLTGRTYISNLISYGIYPDLVKLANFLSVLDEDMPRLKWLLFHLECKIKEVIW